jgi:pimeloyl-ACP methyl ester carboxylesterase
MFSEQQIPGGDGLVNLARGPASGPPLLFMHGVGSCWQDFSALLAPLAARWQIFGFDFRGHGLSQRTAGKYLLRDYVRDAVAVVHDVIRQPVVVYGHSLGAMVAAATAAELPDTVPAAVLEDPPFDTRGPEIRDTPFHALFTAMRSACESKLGVAALARSLAETRFDMPGTAGGVRLGDLRDRPSLRFMAVCLKRVDPTLWDPVVEGRLLDGYDRPALLRRIRCPVLLLQGDVAEGGMLSEAAAAEVETLIADCYRVRVPRAGHLIHNLHAETTLRLLTEFLESIAIDDAPQ